MTIISNRPRRRDQPGTDRRFRLRAMRRVVVAYLLVGVLTTQCGIADAIRDLGRVGRDVATETEAVLDEAIDTLGSESGQWRSVLEKALADLPKEASSLIRNEISNTLSRSIAAAGLQVKCITDFIGARVHQQLVRLRATLLNAPFPALEPALCDPVPTTIDMALGPEARQKVEFFGYDFDATTIQVVHVTKSSTTDVSTHLHRASPYLMTLNLSDNGVKLTSASDRLLLRWGGREISDIAMLQPTTPVCITEQKIAKPKGVTVVPQLTRGDREFKGNGPDVRVVVSLRPRTTRVGSVQTSEIVATYSMYARETKGDYTTGYRQEESVVWTAPEGRVIDEILGQTTEVLSYRDDTVTEDSFDKALAAYLVVADTPGDDVGESKATITFHDVNVALRQVGDCVSAQALMLTIGQKGLSQLTQTRLTTQLQTLPTTLRDGMVKFHRPVTQP